MIRRGVLHRRCPSKWRLLTLMSDVPLPALHEPRDSSVRVGFTLVGIAIRFVGKLDLERGCQ